VGRQNLIALLLGVWLGGTLFMWSVATQNFRIVDRLLGTPDPAFAQRLQPLPPGEARLLLRYQASEVNRLFFNRWGLTQLILGGMLTWVAFLPPVDPRLRLIVMLMFWLAVAEQFAVVPDTIRLGRLLDFAPRDPAPPEAARFWQLHTAYTVLDMGKFLLGIYGAVRLLRARPVR
jgi:hypothetical protein